MTLTPRIYVRCLAAYNNGILHGDWIDASLGKEFIEERIKEILAKSPEPHAEEWAIHDYEGFGSTHLSENPSLQTLAEIAEFIGEHGELGAEVYAYSSSLAHAQEMMESYHGEFKSKADYAYQYFNDCYDLEKIPSALSCHIDWDGVGRDLFICDFVSIEIDGSVHVFDQF